ncbi:hypothetical protein V22_39160 [Calycomorphotria hydatis]|uniref:Uncharacterized protein n=1 Tax=Calycomorphotria hydatis TaxID=2528027 RepID=A0A517TE45_9PLAN|nr:hypothetical protein V22_39160 [Calycomorphotria hydatis]
MQSFLHSALIYVTAVFVLTSAVFPSLGTPCCCAKKRCASANAQLAVGCCTKTSTTAQTKPSCPHCRKSQADTAETDSSSVSIVDSSCRCSKNGATPAIPTKPVEVPELQPASCLFVAIDQVSIVKPSLLLHSNLRGAYRYSGVEHPAQTVLCIWLT